MFHLWHSLAGRKSNLIISKHLVCWFALQSVLGNVLIPKLLSLIWDFWFSRQYAVTKTSFYTYSFVWGRYWNGVELHSNSICCLLLTFLNWVCSSCRHIIHVSVYVSFITNKLWDMGWGKGVYFTAHLAGMGGDGVPNLNLEHCIP